MIFEVVFKPKIFFLLYLWIAVGILTVKSQEPVLVDPQEIELESILIDAMQLVALEKYDEALEKFKDIKVKTKTDGIAEFEIAKIYYVKGNYDEAQFYIEKAIEKDNSKYIYSQLLVDILTKNKKYGEAAVIMENNLNKSYFDRKDYYKIADYYQKSGQTEKALEILNKLENKTLDDSEVELYKYNILLRSKRYKEAIRLVDQYLKKNPLDIRFLEKKALVFRLTNKEEDAEKTYKKILKINPDNPKALSYLSAIKNFNKSEEKYIKGLFTMLRNSKIDEDTKIRRLIPFVSKVSEDGIINKAMFEASNIMIGQYPESAKTNTLYADLLYNSGKISESLSFYEKALKANKNNFQLWKQLMTIYTMQENWNSLLRISEDAIDYYPNQVSGYYYAGRALVNMGKMEKGLEYLQEAVGYASDNYKSEIKLMEAKAFLKLSKYDTASDILDSLDEDFYEHHPYYWELKGDLEFEKGNSEKAKKYWEKSLQLGNNTIRLIEKLKNKNNLQH